MRLASPAQTCQCETQPAAQLARPATKDSDWENAFGSFALLRA